MKVIKGSFNASGYRFGIVVSSFNHFITDKLLEGSHDCLVRHGADDNAISVVYVPGAFEIPPMAQKMAQSRKYDALICLGAVIRGATPHFDYVAGAASNGIAKVALSGTIPVINGVITTNTLEQAIERSGAKAGNKGWDAAMAAMEMISVYKELDAKGE
ncbi:MAG: 6,7-dimethyl-8-ribityllumazine synthase [candidate division Zixibacteria bacterium]|nr:6,7-dimethyl-8-ribityllumazine synthase [candidate division Zixibacteria bacterium]